MQHVDERGTLSEERYGVNIAGMLMANIASCHTYYDLARHVIGATDISLHIHTYNVKLDIPTFWFHYTRRNVYDNNMNIIIRKRGHTMFVENYR